MQKFVVLVIVAIAFSTATTPRVFAEDSDEQLGYVPDLPGTQRPASIPDDETLEKNGATIGKITLGVSDIFDLNNPKENKALFRAANKLHIATREAVVKSYLLFQTGDRYSRRLLDETERSLRRTDFLYDATIVPVAYDGNVVDLVVVTRDVWTLTGGINFSRKGGQSRSGFEVEDANFLGMGHSFSVSHSSDPYRSENLFRYSMPNITGKRTQMQIDLGKNSDGNLYGLSYQKPFFSLDSSTSYGGSFSKRGYDETRHVNGVAVEDYHRDDTEYEVFVGYSEGLKNDHTLQWRTGYTHFIRDYEPNKETRDPTQIPVNETESFPWISLNYIEDRYIKTRRLSFIHQTEDLNLGNEIGIKLGWSDSSLSPDTLTDELIYELEYKRGMLLQENRYLLLDFSGEGRVRSDSSENVVTGGRIRYFEPHHEHQIFYASLMAKVGHDLDDPNLIQLGGDTGLRGYPAHSQDGDRMFLLTLEQRFYSPQHFLEFFYLGGTLFFDIGRAWDPDVGPSPNSGVLKDIGAGLRVTSSRAGKGKVLHIDAAYPLDGDDIERTLQINISMESEF